MAIFRLTAQDGTWFDLEGGGRVQLRLMDAETLRAIRKATTTAHVEYKRVEGKAERFTWTDTDEEAASARFWDHVIMAWEGLLDELGDEIPCTAQTKSFLLARFPAFARFVAESLERLAADAAESQEARQKN